MYHLKITKKKEKGLALLSDLTVILKGADLSGFKHPSSYDVCALGSQ